MTWHKDLEEEVEKLAEILKVEKNNPVLESILINSEKVGNTLTRFNNITESICNPELPKHNCWFCGKNSGERMFSTEFDTYVHLECIQKNRDNPEAIIMKKEFSNWVTL